MIEFKNPWPHVWVISTQIRVHLNNVAKGHWKSIPVYRFFNSHFSSEINFRGILNSIFYQVSYQIIN
jgi:hypothetical protein